MARTGSRFITLSIIINLIDDHSTTPGLLYILYKPYFIYWQLKFEYILLLLLNPKDITMQL